MRFFHTLLLTVVAALLFLAPRAALADESEPDPAADPIALLPWKPGPQPLDLGHGASLALPSGYRFLGQPDAGKLMEKIGNLHNENLLGLVISENPAEGYLVSLRYDEEGFIKDDEKLDAHEILSAIREGEAEYNEERKKLGFTAIHADGWQEEPRYDKSQHHVVWALVVSDETGSSVNLNTRVLGRRGYVSVNLVTEKDELAQYRAHGVDILRATTFTSGNRYEDFDASKDKVAEYGLTGLVLGGAGVGIAKAAKIGILAKAWKGIVALLIAGKKGIVALLAAAAALVRKLLGKKKESAVTVEDAESPPASTS